MKTIRRKNCNGSWYKQYLLISNYKPSVFFPYYQTAHLEHLELPLLSPYHLPQVLDKEGTSKNRITWKPTSKAIWASQKKFPFLVLFTDFGPHSLLIFLPAKPVISVLCYYNKHTVLWLLAEALPLSKHFPTNFTELAAVPKVWVLFLFCGVFFVKHTLVIELQTSSYCFIHCACWFYQLQNKKKATAKWRNLIQLNRGRQCCISCGWKTLLHKPSRQYICIIKIQEAKPRGIKLTFWIQCHLL